MKSVLITGASRGIGLELVRQLCRQDPAPEFVFASCRSPSKATDLQAIAAANKNVKIIEIDVQNEATFAPAVAEVAKLVGSEGLNVLINNAGLLGSPQSIDSITKEYLTRILDINVIGLMLVTKAFLPLLRKAAQNSPVKRYSVERAAVINISSGMGSITDNKSGGVYGYRETKTAVNMFTKGLSLDLKADKILVLSQCPGWVQTDLGGRNASLTPQKSVSDMLTIFSQVSEEHNGCFFKNRIPPQKYEL